jgi:hypothetical protein
MTIDNISATIGRIDTQLDAARLEVSRLESERKQVIENPGIIDDVLVAAGA